LGAGFLTGGIVALVLSFLGKTRKGRSARYSIVNLRSDVEKVHPVRDVAARVFGVRLHDDGSPPRSKKRHGDDFHFVHWRTLESDASLFS
jgi:hypothetical protein